MALQDRITLEVYRDLTGRSLLADAQAADLRKQKREIAKGLRALGLIPASELDAPRRTIPLPILEPSVVENAPAVETGYDIDGQDEMYEMAESDHRDGGPLRAA